MAVDPQVIKDALDNLNAVAEAQVRLAASGQVATASLQQNIQAFQFLRSEIDRTTQSAKKQQEQAKNLAKAFQEFNRPLLSVTAGLAASSAALVKFTHAANPSLVGAFGTQLELLQAKIGNSLLPIFSELMIQTDDLIAWFDGLSEGEKRLVGYLAIGVPLTIGLAHALYALVPALKVAQTSLVFLRDTALKSPSASASGAGVAAVVTAYSFYKLAQGHTSDQHEKSKAEAAATGRVADDDFRRANEVIGAGDRNVKNAKELEAMSENERRAYYTESAKYFRERAQFMQGHALNGNPLNLLRGGVFTEGEIEERLTAAKTFERAAKYGAEMSTEESLKRRAESLSNQIHAASLRNQPHFSNVADVTKQMTLQQLGKTSWDQKKLREAILTRKTLDADLKKVIEQLDGIKAKSGIQ